MTLTLGLCAGKREKGKDRINELSWGYHKVGGEESTERN